MNAINKDKPLTEDELREIIRSYGMLFVGVTSSPSTGGSFNANTHLMAKQRLSRSTDEAIVNLWHFTDSETKTVVEATRKANPFAATERMEMHTFEEAAEIAYSIQENFGKLQNEECSRLREGLMTMDGNATGRIPFKDF